MSENVKICPRTGCVWSVALCTYNGERFLGEQLESIANQTRLPDELVVCDDGSSDSTVEILRRFRERVAFPVRIYVNAKRQGSTRNFEKAVSLCAGGLIALCDQDDFWHRTKLERLGEVFTTRPHVGMVFSDAVIIDERSVPAGQTLWRAIRLTRADLARIKKGRGYEVLARRSVVTGAGMAFRARFVPLMAPFPSGWVHDQWIAMIISSIQGVVAVSDPLFDYRVHDAQQIGVNMRRRGQLPTDPWRGAADRLEAVIRHVESHSREFNTDSPQGLGYFKVHMSHLRARADIRERVGPWLRLLIKELFAGRYHRHAHGLSSAAADLLRPIAAEISRR